MSHKCESVRELLTESLCEFEDVPHFMRVDRKCCECGTARVERNQRRVWGAGAEKGELG